MRIGRSGSIVLAWVRLHRGRSCERRKEDGDVSFLSTRTRGKREEGRTTSTEEPLICSPLPQVHQQRRRTCDRGRSCRNDGGRPISPLRFHLLLFESSSSNSLLLKVKKNSSGLKDREILPVRIDDSWDSSVGVDLQRKNEERTKIIQSVSIGGTPRSLGAACLL